MIESDRARRLARLALEASGARATEVALTVSDQRLLRFTERHPVQNIARLQACLAVRVHVDGRQGKAQTGTLTEEAVRQTVARAIEVARLAPPPAEELPPMPGPAPIALRGAAPLADDPQAAADAVAAITDTVRSGDCQAAGIHDAVTTLRLVANSAGLSVCDLDTSAQLSVSAFQRDGAGWAGQIAAVPQALDVGAIARRAVDKAQRSRDAQGLPPGRYTVVLEPAAVSSLLLFTAGHVFGGQQLLDGSSFLAGRLGQPVLGGNVSIHDDCRHALAVGPVFDGEGNARQRVTLVENGIARAVVHDRVTARRAGCAATGHALPQPSPEGPQPQHLVLGVGAGGTEELVAGVKRGLLVTQFHYTNVVESSALTLTGMTRNGTFLIENGVVTRPVRNLRFTQSLVAALNQVVGLGADATLASALFGGNVIVPSVAIDGFTFSSSTDF